MHELSLVEGLVDMVGERLVAPDLADRTVVAVHLRVGSGAGVLADAMAFCWEVATVGTALVGSRLDITEVDGSELTLASLELLKEDPCARPAVAATPR